MDIFLDLKNGTSGDMLVGALLSLGADEVKLVDGLKSLSIGGFRVSVEKNHSANQTGFHVLKEGVPSIQHVNIFDALEVIQASSLNTDVKILACNIFKIVATAGAEAHQCPLEQFYFHETGASDSFADIVGFSICFADLDVQNTYRSELVDGTGTFQTKTGKQLTLPVPAVKMIAKRYDWKIKQTDINGELITPTGASIIAAIAPTEKRPAEFDIVKQGTGIGTRKYNPDPKLVVSRIRERRENHD